MAIYLVQHGINSPSDIDPEKGLSEEGKNKTALIAGVAKNYNIKVSKILHSGKKRAEETASILASHLLPPNGVHGVEGMKPLDDVISFSDSISMNENIMLVGHLPFLERFLSFRVTADPNQPVFKLQNSGICCIDKVDVHKNPVIKWAIMPDVS